MTTEEQLENWLEPFKQDPQRIIDNYWQHADLYSSSNPIPRSSVCTYIINYDFKVWSFWGNLAEGNIDTWRNFLTISLLFVIFLMTIILIEVKLLSRSKK